MIKHNGGKSSSLEKEFQYYLDNQDELVKLYDGTHIVIVGEEVVGSYDSTIEAFEESVKLYEVGTFLIQYCESGDEAYTQHIYSSRQETETCEISWRNISPSKYTIRTR